MASKKIFLSYSRADSIYIEKLTEALIAAGQDVWIDKKIRSGQTWDQTVEQSIKNCDVLVVVMSKTSMASDNVMDEVSFAIGLNKTIAPILIEDCEVPMRLGRYQHIDFNQMGLEGGTQKLVSDINFDTEEEGSNVQQTKAPIGRVASEQRNNNSKKRLLIIGATFIVSLVVLVATNALNFGDDSDDIPINLVESATSDDAAWKNAKSINRIKAYLDYFTKYSEDGNHLDSANTRMNELAYKEGVVEYSETSGDTKENHFIIYNGEKNEEINTPEVGDYIISLENNDVDLEIEGNGKKLGSIEKNQVAKVLVVQESGDKVYCTVTYNQLTR
jgi:hypothetical protein